MIENVFNVSKGVCALKMKTQNIVLGQAKHIVVVRRCICRSK